jgi:hypothetical protein
LVAVVLSFAVSASTVFLSLRVGVLSVYTVSLPPCSLTGWAGGGLRALSRQTSPRQGTEGQAGDGGLRPQVWRVASGDLVPVFPS